MINIKLGKSYTTHIGVLVRALQMSQGDVIELGVGPYSTPLLHWLCKDKGRQLISYEDNPDYYNFAKQFRSKLHKIIMVKDWNDVDTTRHRGWYLLTMPPLDVHRMQLDLKIPQIILSFMIRKPRNIMVTKKCGRILNIFTPGKKRALGLL